MERERSKKEEPTRRAEDRGRWRDAAQREQENMEREAQAGQEEGVGMDRDRMERDRMERERVERDRMERERMERESGGELAGRGIHGGSPLAMRDPLIASHFDFMRQFMREMSRMFEGWPFTSRPQASSGFVPSSYGSSSASQGSLSGWPPIEVAERDGRMVVRAELPGIDIQDVKVRLEGNYLLIEGERRDQRERHGERDAFYESEWSYGRFSRRIPVPSGVTPDTIHATCENGVLELTMDVPSQNVREIPIRTGDARRDEGYDERRRERDSSSRTQH